jgi:glycosyltransferase involved in cell wall biosynthesis
VRILVDCRYVRVDRHDGISRYSARITEALARLHPVTMLIHDERQLPMLPDLPWEKIEAPTSLLEPLVARHVNRLNPDVVWTPMQTMGAFGRRYGFVNTVHDLIYYVNRTPPRDLPWFIRIVWRLYHYAWWPQRLLLNAADEVVTVSYTTKALISAHHLTRHPVSIVSNAADPPVGVQPRTAPTTRTLVYMGSYMPYKNVETLVAGMHELPGYTLHLLGRTSQEVRDRLTPLAPEGSLVFDGPVSDAEYAAALDAATALVHASMNEGFGIPLVESMARGTPIVVSDIPVFREVGEDAALYFTADDPSAFAAAVRELEAPREWALRSAASRDRASHYSWEASAEALLAVLTRVAAARTAR